MAHLRKQIDSIKLHREIARERRRNVPLPVVAIVGYTNTGKSTLLNKLVQVYGERTEPIYADNKLFATLDPTTRRIRMPSGRWALFTDTVGFIDKLPHHLIAAFRSTLEETLDADVMVHLIDATDKSLARHSETVFDILNSLETHKDHYRNKMILAYNKTDLLSGSEKSKLAESQKALFKGNDSPDDMPPPVYISAAQGNGLNDLLGLIEEKLSRQLIETDVFVPFKKSGMLESLYRLGKVEQTTHHRHGTHLRLRMEKSHWNKVQKLLHDGKQK
jgi:GTP-binding protein HflX